MWRALFLAIGVSIFLVGVQFLGVEKVVLKLKGEPPPQTSPFDTEVKPAPPISIVPAPWAPYSLMACGAVVCLYSFTIPRRLSGG